MTRPRLAVAWPRRRRPAAMSLRVKPSSLIAKRTRSDVPDITPGSPFSTRETVFRLTPARDATSRMVGRAGARDIFDNVVINRDYEAHDGLLSTTSKR